MRQTEREAAAARGQAPVSTLVAGLVLVPLLAQRLAIPVGQEQVPVALPVVLALLLVGHRRGVVSVRRSSLRLYLLLALAAGLSTFSALSRGVPVSVLSLAFLLVIYAVGTVSLVGLSTAVIRRGHVLFIRTMVVCGLVGVAQFLAQLSGWQYRDLLAASLPEPVLLRAYNTGNPIFYGSDVIRSNGVVFLEPSFLSFFLGLALVIGLKRGVPAITLAVLAASLLPTVAGNGPAVVAASLPLLLLGGSGRTLRRLLLPVALVAVLAAYTPLGGLFVERSTEVSSDESSASLRLVQPYDVILPEYLASGTSIILGNGAGSADRLVAATGRGGLLAPVVPKLLYEYGIIVTVCFFLFLLHLCLRRPIDPWVPGVLLTYLVLNAGLLQVTFAITTLVFCALLRKQRACLRDV